MENVWADTLSKLASDKENGQLSTVIRQVLTKVMVECMFTFMVGQKDWRKDVKVLMRKQDEGEAISSTDTRKIAWFIFAGEDLY